MNGSRKMKRAVAVVLGCGALLIATAALGRPGGGHSFSSGGSHSFGGGSHSFGGGSHSYSSSGYHSSSGGSGELITILFVQYPWVGWPLALVIVGFALYGQYQKSRGGEGWSSGEGSDDSTWSLPEPEVPAVPWRDRLLKLRTVGPVSTPTEPFDPDFSIVLFEDFVYALYARVQQARAEGMEPLAAYVNDDARALLTVAGRPASVSNVVIGAMKYVRVSDVTPSSEWVTVTLEFEANYTQRETSGREPSYYVVDRWKLRRSTAAKSRPPEKARVLDCPNCGAPLSAMRGDTCSHCGQQVGTGEFHWALVGVEFVRRDERAPQLTGTVQEVGTDLPTRVAPDALARLKRLGTDDATFSWDAFRERVRLTYAVMNDAWTTLQWEKARPFLSDNLFQMQSYWIDAYKAQGLRNVLEQMQVSRIDLAKVVRDAWFDAITVRVHASGLDYTIDEGTGSVVGGNRNRPRAYTEYWTFIRGAGVKKAITTEEKCPNCGAELAINMAGNCEYCQAKVTSGDFDWVLSRIEQDETYGG